MPAVPVNDTHIYYIDVGSGIPTLVMHGGMGLDHTFMHPWLDPLGDTLRLFYYDHRGHGRSAKAPGDMLTLDTFTADAEALRRHLGFGQMAVIGHSFGGFVALEYALRYPDKISHLILADTAAFVDYGRAIIENVQRKSNDPEVLGEFLQPNADDDFAFAWHLRTTAPLYFHKYNQGLAERLFVNKQLSAVGYSRNAAIIAEYNVLPRLKEIKIPTLIITGVDDFLMPVSQALRMHREMPNATLVKLPESGHYPHVEQPQEFCDAVRRWIRG